MFAYIFITISLLFYPILGWIIVKRIKHSPKFQKRLISLGFLTFLIISKSCLTHLITISQHLNWFLITFNYLIISLFLFMGLLHKSLVLKRISKILAFIIFTSGYFLSTFGFFFLMIFSSEITIDYEKQISKNLIYQERNISSGPDPSIIRKKIEVYKKINLFPLLAIRITSKEYDNWEGQLGPHLSATINQSFDKIILENTLDFENEIHLNHHWSDTITLY